MGDAIFVFTDLIVLSLVYTMCHSVVIYVIYKDSHAAKIQFNSLN